MHLQQKNQLPVVDLKLWIFKFIRNDKDEFAVCIEGYRKKDAEELQLENWRSTAIKERYNSVTLLTISGSKYVLHGVIDQDSAYGLGYPKTLIERFKDGFPFEWRELLGDYYSNVVRPNKLNASQRLHSALLSSVLLDTSKCSRNDKDGISTFRNVFDGYEVSSVSKSNEKRAKCLLIKNKIVQQDEEISKEKLSSSKSFDNCIISIDGFSKNFGTSFASLHHDSNEQTCSGLSMQAYNDNHGIEIKRSGEDDLLEDKPEEDTLFKMPLLPIQQRQSKPVDLYNWTIRFSASDLGHSTLFPNFAFVIVGFRPDKNLDWKTSCIVAVDGNRLLRTETGAYELMGPINTVLAMQQGFPKEFVTQFLNGFPKDWHRILSLFFNTYIEPQLPPQQSLTISEICDDDEMENLHHPDFERSLKSCSSDDNDSCSSSSDSLSSNGSIQNCREKLKFTKRSISKKCVRYRIGDSYQVNPAERRGRQSNGFIPSAKRMKLEKKNPMRNSANLSLLKMTKSGRTVKPRLATWTGQRIMYNIRGSPIKAIGITTDSIYSTSTSDLSSLPTLCETNLRQALQKENQKHANTKRVPLVVYSDSGSSYFDDSDDADRKLSSPTPVTPFRGKRGHRSSRMILSSPDESMRKKTAKKRKLRKHRNRTCKKIPSKQKNKSDKPTFLNARNAQKKGDDKQGNVEVTVPIVSFSDVDSENGIIENVTTGKIAKNGAFEMSKKTRAKKWTENDNTRLKLAVRAVYPQSEKDWENISALMRTRTVEECRKQALEVLKLNIAAKENKTMDVSSDVVDAFRKTKVGTLAYQIQADRYTRQYLKAGDGSDFFEETMDMGSNGRKVAMIPSVTTFDSDDSLLSVLRTPTPKSVRRNVRRNKLISIPESPGCSTPRNLAKDSDELFKFDPDDEAYRKGQLRYVHKMLKVRNQHPRSRANVAKSSISKYYHLNLPIAQCHQNDSDTESKSDEYFEEEI